MKIVITGCAGMIGSYLTSKLLSLYPAEQGHQIIGIDNLSRGKLSNLEESCTESYKELIFINSDLTIFKNDWAQAFSNCDLVIHLADVVAGIGYVFANESYVFRTNLLINSNISKAIYENKPKRYIYVGTACSFPRDKQLSTKSVPLVEEDQFPAAPESGYGWSKLMGEIESKYLANEGITNSVILSLHNVYGRFCDFSPSTSQVIPSLCLKAISATSNNKILEIWGDGNQGRAFIHAKDVVKAIILSIKKGENQGVIQIGPSECTTIKDLARIIINNLDKDIKLKYDLSKPVGDTGRSANYAKAKKILNWEPSINLNEGLKDLISWIITKNS